MSYADKVFIEMCRDIIDNGTSTEGEKVRPRWEDGTPAYTVKKFGVVNRYDLRKEFPALTLRRTGIKSCTDELLWIYVHQDLQEMNLYPCAYSMTFNVTKEKGSDKLTLNGILNQRSQDVLAANNWNVCQYAVLLHMLAQVCDMQVGEFVHVIADAHIYDRHISLIEELLSRETHPAPKFWLNPEVKDFYQFTPDDVRLDDYVTGPQIKNIPIAV